jgi:hypothetical protein
VPLTYATVAAHIAAGLGILFRVLPFLAATLETVMVSLFTLLIWVQAVLGTPKAFDWTELPLRWPSPAPPGRSRSRCES